MNHLIVEIFTDQITIKTRNGNEVVHWVSDEWEEDPSITPAIANAIRMAYEEPGALMRMNEAHLRSQFLMRSKS